MDAKIDAKKVIRKRDRNRVLKALAYVAGFPLFILLVFIGSVPFMNGAAFEATKYYGVIVCIAAWAVLILVQIIAALVTKNSTARGVIVIIVTLIVMVGGSVYFDIWAEGKLNTTRDNYVRERYGISEDTELVYLKNQINKDILTFRDDDYVRNTFKLDSKTKLTYSEDQYGIQYVTFTRDNKKYTKAISIEVDIDNYATQINHYVTWTDKSSLTDEFNEKIADFCRVYNIEYESAVKGAVNTDGSEYGATKIEDADGNPEYWFGETGKVYKENGLYADGYIFGVESASRILIAYYDTQNYYAAQGLDADEELEKALEQKAEDGWTTDSKEAYQAAWNVANEIFNNANASQTIVDSALGSLQAAYNNAEMKANNVDALQAIVGGMISNEKIIYTSSTYSAYENAVNRLAAALKNADNLSQTKADSLQADVEAAQAALIYTVSRLSWKHSAMMQ